MSITNKDLFSSIERRLKNLPELNEAFYSKYLLYKEFDFVDTRLDGVADLFAGIQHTISYYEETHYLLLETRLLDSQDALINALKELYSERIHNNPKLQELVENTIVPYYSGRFQIAFSREISFLPVELRLYIYSRLLHIEASSIRQMYLVDRIALTLHKADERFLGDCATFISAWIKSKMSKETTGRKIPFTQMLSMEIQRIRAATTERTKILKEAELTSKEFWYGLKGFSDLNNIHNAEVAQICLELFCSYYKDSSFGFIRDMKPVFLEYYETKNPIKINQLIKDEDLNEIELKKRYVTFFLDSKNSSEQDLTEQIDLAQKNLVQNLIENPKKNQYLFINPTKNPVNPDIFNLPEEISQMVAANHFDRMMQILRSKRMTLSDYNRYLFSLSTSIMCSDEWDLKIQNVIVGLLADIYGKVWLRDKEHEKDIISQLKAAKDITQNKANVYHLGKGWPVSVIIAERKFNDKTCVIYYSKNPGFEEFVGQFFVGGNPKRLNAELIENAVKSLRNYRIHWQRIEQAQNPSRTVQRKRANYWQRVKEAREIELD